MRRRARHRALSLSLSPSLSRPGPSRAVAASCLSPLPAPSRRQVAGLSKRELLRGSVLPALATNRQLQRLVAEFLEMVKGA